MSILNVEHLSHGFGDRTIFTDVSFRLLKGEHIGLIGANGEGKSTFMNIITGKLTPDEGKVEWARHVRVGYLDQHSVLEPGMTIRDVLRSAFDFLYEMEAQVNEICDKLGSASEEEMNALLEEMGTLQDLMDAHDFYMIDSKVEEVAKALGLLDLGLDRDVTELSGGQRQRVWIALALAQQTDILLLDEPTTYLDIAYQVEILDLLTDLNKKRNTTILMVLHDINLSARYADYIFAMYQGRLEAQGAPLKIITPGLIKKIYGLDCQIIPDPVSRTPLVIPEGRHHKTIQA